MSHADYLNKKHLIVDFVDDAEVDPVLVEVNACISGDDDFDREVEHNILGRLHEGDVWAWAAVTVVASWNGFKGTACLGCCSYADEQDFRQPNGYFDDMVAEAIDDLNAQIQNTYAKLKTRELATTNHPV